MLLRHEGFRRLCEARDRLRQLDDPPSIAALACDLHVSPFHFIRQFEAVFGVTPHQFRIDARLDAAKDLLAEGRCSVTDVCMEVGFSSLGSFSTLFTRRVGVAPSAFRRRARSLVQVPGRSVVEPKPGCLTLLACLPPEAFDPRRNFREASHA